jgi:hypothetical protein
MAPTISLILRPPARPVTKPAATTTNKALKRSIRPMTITKIPDKTNIVSHPFNKPSTIQNERIDMTYMYILYI